jgi:hypothetical protein
MDVEVFTAPDPDQLRMTVRQWLRARPGVVVTAAAQSLDAAGRIVLTAFYTEPLAALADSGVQAEELAPLRPIP